MTTQPPLSRRSFFLLVTASIVTLFITTAAIFAPHAYAAETLGPNLIANPSLEATSSTPGIPADWAKGGYGDNTRTLTYPVTPAADGASAARVTISSYTSGDAKWYFDRVPVTPGDTYRFSDESFGTVPSEIDVQVTNTDGSKSYLVLGTLPASSSYQTFSAEFTAPSGAASVTMFHLIQSVGSLTVDNYALNQVQTSGPPNLIQNGSFEIVGSNGAPVGWAKGGYGNNTRTLTYPVPGVSGNGAKTAITSYTSGDAKWYFTPIHVSPGIYTYADSYQSTATSTLTVQLHNADGSYTYEDIAQETPSSSFTHASASLVVPPGTQDVTVFHLIDSVGTLTIDNASLVDDPPVGVFSTGAVTLTFDDGWESQYTNALPVMQQDDLVGTFYIVSHQLADYDFAGFLSKAQIKTLYTDGEEIGAHTQTHPYLTTLTAAQQEQEIDGSRQDLLAMNVGPINSFAYPYGDFDSTTVSIVKAAGFTNARATIDAYAVPTSDRWELPRLPVEKTTTAAEVESWIQTALAEKTWLILTFHRIDTSGDQYSTTPATFTKIANYLAANHVPVVTMNQGVQSLVN